MRALENCPTAFLTTLEETREQGSKKYQSVLDSSDDKNIILGALLSDKVIGMLGVRAANRVKRSHKAIFWGMYVDAEFRRKGVGRKLLELAIDHAKYNMGSVAIFLSVESTNTRAKNLYQSQGFVRWGIEPKAIKFNNKYYNEDHMVLEL